MMDKDKRLQLIMQELGGINIAVNQLADSLRLIADKSTKLQAYLGKAIWVETKRDSSTLAGKVVSVDNHWITIMWSPISPVEKDTAHFTNIAIDSIEAFGIEEEEVG